MPALFTGANYLWLDQTNSTNTYLREWATEKHLPEGTVVSAGFQSQGRGQQGAQWHAESGQNILLSCLYYPTFLSTSQQFGMSMAAALAVADTARKILPSKDVLIKWPNDIWVEDRKLAGILIENSLNGNRLNWSIIGIGLNMNQLTFDSLNATSLAAETGKPLARQEVEELLFGFLEARYLQLRQRGAEGLLQDYYDMLLGYQELRHYEDSRTHELFEARLTGIASDGRLQLQLPDQSLRQYDIKEVKFCS